MQEKVKLNSRNFSEVVAKIWLETCCVRQADRQIEYEAYTKMLQSLLIVVTERKHTGESAWNYSPRLRLFTSPFIHVFLVTIFPPIA